MKTKTFYSITDCSRLLGVQEHRIAYAHRTSKLPEPKIRVAGKRVYSPAELRRMAAYFQADKGNSHRGAPTGWPGIVQNRQGA